MGTDKPDLRGKVKFFLSNTENAKKELQKLIKEALFKSGPTGLFKNRARTDRKAIGELRKLRTSLLKNKELDFGYHLKELELNFTDKSYFKSLIKIECFHESFFEGKRDIDHLNEYFSDEGFEEAILSMFNNLVDWFGEKTLDTLIKERKNKFLLPLICPFVKEYDWDLGLRAYNFHDNSSPEISVFLKELISQIKPKKILDINFKPSSFSTYSKDIEWNAFCYDEYLCKSSNIFFDSNRVSLASFKDNSLIFEQNISKKYDFIIFNPDPKVHTRTRQIQHLIKSKDFLEKDGIIVFCMPSNSIKSNDFLEELNKKDLHISAIFDTDDFFQRKEPDHEAEMYLPILYKCSIVLISNKSKNQVFLANLSNKNTHGNNIAVKNYLKNQVNKNNLSFGTFIDIKNYRGIDFLTSRNKHEKLHKKISGLIPKKVSEISNIIFDFNDEKEFFFDPSINEEEISSIRKTFKTRNELDKSDSIFVSKYQMKKNDLFGSKLEKEVLRDSPENLSNYFYISLKTEYNSIFLVNYFNSKIGSEILRENRTSGKQMNTLSLEDLKEMIIYIPKLTIQNKIVGSLNITDNLISSFNELKTNILTPKEMTNEKLFVKIEKIEERIDSLKTWIDTLPFPIGSILGRYISTVEKSEKIDHLLRFFESYSIFISTIVLSALNNNREFYNKYKNQWRDSIEDPWITQSSFGNWNNFYNALRLFLVGYLKDDSKKKREVLFDLFATDDLQFYDFILNGEIVRILKNAKEIRNQKKAHGGLIDNQIDEILQDLEVLLNKLRNKIGDNFEYIKLIYPGDKSIHKDGLFNYKNCKELTGQREPFQQKRIISSFPLDHGSLYYQYGDNKKLVKLLPFVKYFETKKAMYFYSRILGNNIDYISHHYSDSEDTGEPLNDEFLDILKSIFNLDLNKSI